MKLELGKIFTKTPIFRPDLCQRSRSLCEQRRVEKLVLEDDKLLECHLDIARRAILQESHR